MYKRNLTEDQKIKVQQRKENFKVALRKIANMSQQIKELESSVNNYEILNTELHKTISEQENTIYNLNMDLEAAYKALKAYSAGPVLTAEKPLEELTELI